MSVGRRRGKTVARCVSSTCGVDFCEPPIFFFFNDTATTEIYTLSLHDALPISGNSTPRPSVFAPRWIASPTRRENAGDRKSTRLNSSHSQISYAVFCLKKNKILQKSENLECKQMRDEVTRVRLPDTDNTHCPGH